MVGFSCVSEQTDLNFNLAPSSDSNNYTREEIRLMTRGG
jgi:hypothetical protein